MFSVVARLLGAGLIILALRDNFHQLFGPTGRGSMSGTFMRVVWHLCSAGPPSCAGGADSRWPRRARRRHRQLGSERSWRSAGRSSTGPVPSGWVPVCQGARSAQAEWLTSTRSTSRW
jgi:hypothetical protein